MAGHLKITRNRSTDFDDSAWLERSRYWKDQDYKPLKTSRCRHLPLVIGGHGAGLNVCNGALVIRNGFTHYPEKRKEHRLFPRDPEMPSRIVLLDGTGSISFDAIDWLATQNVQLIRINWRGEVQAMFGGIGYSADPEKTHAQRLAKLQKRDIEIGTELIRKKLFNCIATLRASIPSSVNRAKSISRIENCRCELANGGSRTLLKLLSIEGQAAIAYFEAWREIPMRWTGINRKPMPKDWQSIASRSSTARTKSKNRNASHPVNAMMNYAYAVLQSRVQTCLLANGYDPTIGFLHSSRADRLALVFDLMEPFRPIVDRAVIEFVKSNAFHPNDFTLHPDGVCRLNPSLARRLVLAIEQLDCGAQVSGDLKGMILKAR